jgi:hypothetical protein
VSKSVRDLASPPSTRLVKLLRRHTNPIEVTVVQHPVKTVLPALMLAIAAGSSTGCSGPSVPGPTPPTSAAPTSAAPTPAAPTSTRATPAAAALSTQATSRPPTAAISAQACSSEVLLPLMKRKFDDPSRGLVIERVRIERCRNGYAHVFAVTRRNPPGPNQYENEQLFLRLVDGQWQSVAEGTGISCRDDDVRPELAAVCRGLGY